MFDLNANGIKGNWIKYNNSNEVWNKRFWNGLTYRNLVWEDDMIFEMVLFSKQIRDLILKKMNCFRNIIKPIGVIIT